MFRLTLFGGIAIFGEQGEVKLSGAKLEALLALLAAAGTKPVPREWLTDVLWGSRFEDQARQSLRQALTRLRKTLGKDIVVADERVVGLRVDLVTSDLAEFDALSLEKTIEALRQAAKLSASEFLAGLNLREGGFADWVALERHRIANKRRKILLQIAQHFVSLGDGEEALTAIDPLLSEDPLDEEVHRLRLVALDALGRKTDALKLHHAFSERLKRELGAAASLQTEEVVRRLSTVQSPQAQRENSPGPSLLVLPFANLSGEDLNYFAEGVVDELIVALSRLQWLTILSRSSTFSDRARSIDARQAGDAFGVRYALEGSIRRADQKVRITGELIDTGSGAVMWSERFEGTLENVFELQDRFTSRVIGTLQNRLERAEIERTQRKPTNSLDAYEHYLRGLSEVHRWSRESNDRALEHFYRAVALDPRFAASYGMAARCFSQRKTSAWVIDEVRERAEAERLASCAVEFGPDNPIALSAAGIAIAFVACKVEEGARLIEQALALNPGLATGWLFMGWVRAWSGDADQAIGCVDRAIHLSPHDPGMAGMRRARAFAHFIGARYELALMEAQSVSTSPQNAGIALATTAASAALLGDLGRAREEVVKLRRLEPKLRSATLRNRFPILRDDDFRRFSEALAMAGLPQ